MDDRRPTFDVLIRGADFTPANTPIADLFHVLSETEKAIRSLALAARPGQSDLVLNLLSISFGSNVCTVTSNRPAEAREAFERWSGALRDRHFDRLPSPARESALALKTFAEKRGASVGFARDRNDEASIAWVTPDTPISLLNPTVYGETTVFGEIIRVGGREPKIGLTTSNGFLTCEADRSIARLLGGRLYEVVGLEGTAQWDPADWSIRSFRVSRVLDYVPTPILEAITLLAEAAGPDAWADEDDIVAAIREYRGE